MSDFFERLIMRNIGKTAAIRPRPVSLYEGTRDVQNRGKSSSFEHSEENHGAVSHRMNRMADRTRSRPAQPAEGSRIDHRMEAAASTHPGANTGLPASGELGNETMPETGPFADTPPPSGNITGSTSPSDPLNTADMHNGEPDTGTDRTASSRFSSEHLDAGLHPAETDSLRPFDRTQDFASAVSPGQYNGGVDRLPGVDDGPGMEPSANSINAAPLAQPVSAARRMNQDAMQSPVDDSFPEVVVRPHRASIDRNDASGLRPRNGILPWASHPNPSEPDLKAPRKITITIGRVDVRANLVAPPAPPRAQPERRTMSLEDYLKNRGGNRP